MKRFEKIENYSETDVREICDRIKWIIYAYFEDKKYLESESVWGEHNSLPDLRFKLYFNNYVMMLSNGNRFDYNVPKSSLAHLVGVNTDYLKQVDPSYYSGSSYEILKLVIDNPSRIINKKNIDVNKVFSPWAKLKANYFADNVIINPFNTDFVCDFDSSKSWAILDEDIKGVRYVVLQHNDAGQYFVLLIAYDERLRKCVPESSRVYENEEKAIEYLKQVLPNQNICILNCVNNQQYKNVYINDEIKLKKAEGLKKYEGIFKANPSTMSNYMYLLRDNLSKTGKMAEMDEFVDEVINSVENHKAIQLTDEQKKIVPLWFLEVTDAYNNNLYRKVGNQSFTDVVNERDSLKSENDKLQAEIAELQSVIADLNVALSEMTEKYTDDERIIGEIAKAVKDRMG